jgi:hypothetical protein
MSTKFAYFIAGAFVAVAATAVAHLAETKMFHSSSHVLLAPEDYLEIQQLYGMYARDVDPGSVQDASWMFTKDAVVIMDSYKTVSTAMDVQNWYQLVQKNQKAGVRHFNTSYVIVGTPDGGARGSAYMMQVERKTEGGPAEVTLFGKYEDKFVKTADGWRIKERVWRADTFRDSLAPVTPSPVPGNRNTDATGAEAAIASSTKSQLENPTPLRNH